MATKVTNHLDFGSSARIQNLPAAASPGEPVALDGSLKIPSGVMPTGYATTADLSAAVAALVASAPSTLDTINELATALASDPNFATTMTNALALKAPLASPTLTGTPAAPTASPGTNTTQIATTAFVAAALVLTPNYV